MANGNEESKITIKAWGIIVLFLGVFGFFFVTAMAHESRLTKAETTLEVNIANMAKALDKLSCTLERHMENGK